MNIVMREEVQIQLHVPKANKHKLGNCVPVFFILPLKRFDHALVILKHKDFLKQRNRLCFKSPIDSSKMRTR